MIRVFATDLRRLFRSRVIWLGSLGMLLLLVLSEVLLYVIFPGEGENYADMILTDYPRYSAILLGIVSGSFVQSEFRQGVIRNKIVGGVKRWEILLSMMLTQAVFALIVQGCFTLFTEVLASCFTDGFLLTPQQRLIQTGIYMIAEVLVACIYVVIIFLLGEARIASGITIAIAVGTMIINAVIMEDLYPSDGICKLSTGLKTIYMGIDNYLPFSYLSSFWHQGYAAFGISVLLSLVFLAAGFVIFEKKDLK